ncbi:hypothetical protein CAPTEDRAFT_168755 [Capitella teleta]|uniref:VWFA domain-containing protein n=1 Tax=Capitella teleta TaxID=283909 RepID=R7TBB8_CAPTE|nr:hypothetical protein CAPTEDRAFT_168755 [Capitella teleta]|eukprot:ELT91033.1 hypothetical protein CAPTEDRAFT_168755 [Capitella teleta]
MDVKSLSSSRQWLQNYGLKKNRLDMVNILHQIGFQHSDGYDGKLKKPICSRYAGSLFQRYFRSDGKTFNVSNVYELSVAMIEHRLQQAIKLYKRRLEWLTTESRRVFGTIEEKSVAIVLDIRNLSPRQFEQYKAGVERVVKEQITSLAKFNLIRACEDLEAYSPSCVPVSSESIEGALEWLQTLNRCAPISATATCEAVVKALSDQNLEAVYLFTEGASCNGARELLREKLIGSRIPVHVISYNCTDADTITFLKDMTKITGARFHAYAVIMELDTYENSRAETDTSQANILLKKRTYGGVPPGAGIRDDVIVLFEELEEARNNLGQIQGLMEGLPESKEGKSSAGQQKEKSSPGNETYMSSREWLEKHGLKSKGLDFYDILSGVAFKHQDGVVDIRKPPEEDYLQTDSVLKPKLVNAKYCENFPHIRWKNGAVVHVQVTPEIHRNYEQKMQLALESLQQRVDWLSQGSRELFGTVIEDQVYFLIDTSSSMQPHIQFVKDKLFVLMQEQLRHKQKFNLVSFDSRAVSWKDRLVDVNEKSLHQGWSWIKELSCRGSTNTMGALRIALNDQSTQAIYLLTDGRPDQPPKSILSQVSLQQNIPIHTISFNCADREANEFLCQLAKDTGGRFHYYSEEGIDPNGPEPWESEDVRLLKKEMDTGYRNLEKVAMLRDECALLAWNKDDLKNSRDACTPDKNLHGHQTVHCTRISLSQQRTSLRQEKQAHHHHCSSALDCRSVALGVIEVKCTGRNFYHEHTLSGLYIKLLCSLTLEHRILGCKKNIAGLFLHPETLFAVFRLRNFCKQMPTRKWLAKHGLSAQKLTILDALSPTFIPHQPKYVPIINKHVMSKVFDDVLPIACKSSSRKNMRIVNPQGVNLDAYQLQVKAAMEKYNKRLNRIVWEALPENERTEFQSSVPISFLDNKLALMQALDRCDWPIREQDVVLLETEIRQAEVYLQQANDLKAAGKDRGKKILENKSQQKDKKVQMTSVKTKRALDSLRGQKVIGRNEVDGFYYSGISFVQSFVNKCTDPRHALVEYNEIGKQNIPTRFVIPMGGAISRPPIRIGDYILARVVNQDTGLECYVPGIVQMTPHRMEDAAKYFTVIMYTGQMVNDRIPILCSSSHSSFRIISCGRIW